MGPVQNSAYRIISLCKYKSAERENILPRCLKVFLGDLQQVYHKMECRNVRVTLLHLMQKFAIEISFHVIIFSLDFAFLLFLR